VTGDDLNRKVAKNAKTTHWFEFRLGDLGGFENHACAPDNSGAQSVPYEEISLDEAVCCL
jgi:hypothetical protein